MAKGLRDIYVGIDLGTTTSEVAIFENNKPQVLTIGKPIGERGTERKSNSPIFDSAVNLKNNLVGYEALTPEFIPSTYTSLKKRFIIDADERINEPEKGPITPYEYQLIILNTLYDKTMGLIDVEEEFEFNIKSVTVTVPTDFKNAHRTKMMDLVKGSKWGRAKKVSILDEPIAASLAKLQDQPNEGNGQWMTYDLGGGTFDASLLETFDVDNKKVHKVHINRGDLDLGGFQFDNVLWELALNSIEEKDIVDKVRMDSNFAKAMKDAFILVCGDIKLALDKNEVYEDVLKIKTKSYGTEIISIRITRKDYWNGILPYINTTVEYCKEILDYAKEHNIKVDGITWVGGSTLDPQLRKYVKAQLGLEKDYMKSPVLAVAMGAALYAAIESEGVEKLRTAILDTVSSPIGFTLADGTIMWVVNEGDPLPFTKEHVASGVQVGQVNAAFSFVEASKLYYGIDQLQGDFFVSREITVSGFQRVSYVPDFKLRFDIDSNKIVNVTISQMGTNVVKNIKNLEVFNQKDNAYVHGRLQDLLRESYTYAKRRVANIMGRNTDVQAYLENALESLSETVQKRPELSSLADLRAIAKGANDAIDEQDRDAMYLWLCRVLSKAGLI